MTDTGYELLAQILITVAVVWLVFRMFSPVRRREKMKTFLVYDFGPKVLGGVRATSQKEVAKRYGLTICGNSLFYKGSPIVFFLEELNELPDEFFSVNSKPPAPSTDQQEQKGERPELTPLSENGPDPGLLTDKMKPFDCADPPEPPPNDEPYDPDW